MFKTRNTTMQTLFRDGQTIQELVGTDSNDGQTATLDVTVNVMK
jgi:hypothetical protein